MRKALLMVILVSLAMLSGQVEWQDDGIPVRQGVNIEWFRSAIDIPGGGCVYTWSDTRLGDRDVFAQRVDDAGNLVWGAEAILINGVIDRQEDIVVINGAADETIYAWVDFRNEIGGDIYAQKLDGDGNIMWAEEGIPLCLAENIQITLNIVSDDEGGAYVIWLDDRNVGGTDIFGTHILSDGSVAAGWDVDGNPIAAASGIQDQHTFWADGEGGAICVWHDARDSGNENLYMQRIAADGSQLWEEGGSILCDAPAIQESCKMSPDGMGGFIITWSDRRFEESGDIFANRIDLDGNVLWAEDLVVYAGAGTQRNPRITQAADGGALIAWEDGRNDGDYKDLFTQKISINGTIEWSVEGEIVSDEANHQLNPRLEGDATGGCWIIWDDGRDGDFPHINIFVQHFDVNGTALLETDGRVVCDAFGVQESPLIKKDSTGQIFLIWGDNRTGSIGIYHQLIDDSGNMLLQDNGALVYYGLCGDGTDFRMLGKSNSRMLFWKDTRKAVVASQIYVQTLLNDGSFGLIEDGVPITEMTEANQENLQCELFGENAVLAWEELRGDKTKIYCQMVDDSVSYMWGDMGLQLSDRDTNQSLAHLSVYNDACYVGWSDVNNDDFENPIYLISAQKVIDGAIQWDSEGIIVADNPGDDVLSDVVDNYFIWELQVPSDFNVYVSKVTEDGAIAENWAENGLLVCGAPANQQYPKGLMTANGLLVVWEDLRSMEDTDIYGQMLDSDGTALWADGGITLVAEMEDQSGFKMQYYQNNIYIIWSDMRGGLDYDIYMQKFDLNGNEQWETGGIPVAVKPNQQANPAFTIIDNTIMIYWDDVINEIDVDLYAKKINTDGELMEGWDPDGLLICGAIKSQLNPMAVTDGAEYSYVIWSDFRSSGKTDIYNIYAQKLRQTFNAMDENELAKKFNINLNNFPNPFRNGTILTFNLGREYLQDAVVDIFNVKGQKVRTLEAETNRVYWDGCDNRGKMTATGVYMYQFKNKYFTSETSKMIRIK